MKIPEIKLNTGAKIPQIGFGLWRNTSEKECKDSVKLALKAGFRHFDDAQAYSNEQYVGQAIKESKIARKDLFITTKIATENMWWTDVIPTFEESLRRLQVDYVDLLLLHFPVTEKRGSAWIRMEQIYDSSKAKAIGVSNYTIKHLKEMKDHVDVWPAVNQVEMSVVLQQPELVDYCRANNIVVEAYTPLAEGLFFDNLILKELAKKYKKSVPQIMLRWCIDYGVVPLTKSVHASRIKENLDIFDFALDASDMKELKKLDKNFRTNWDPTNVT